MIPAEAVEAAIGALRTPAPHDKPEGVMTWEQIARCVLEAAAPHMLAAATARDEVVEAAAMAAHKAGSQYNDIEWTDLPSPLQKHYWFMAAAAIQSAAL